MHTHRGDCRQKFRTTVGLLTSWQGEGAIPVITIAEEHSAARPSEPCILIAHACTISSRHNAAVILSFTFKSRVCKNVDWQSVATHGQWLCTYSSVLPRRRPRGLRGRFYIARCTAPTAGDLDCLVLVIHGEESPTAGTAKACGLRLQVLHHKRGGDNHTVFCVQRQPQRSAGCFSALTVSWCCSKL